MLVACSVAVCVFLLSACTADTDHVEVRQLSLSPMDSIILADRESKDTWFLEDERSPLSESVKSTFDGLVYYPLNRDFRVLAQVEYLGTHDTIAFATSDTSVTKYYTKELKLTFDLLNKTHTLFGYGYTGELREKYPHDYFLPFTDNTTGNDTYGAGRYMEVSYRDSDTVLLDFNTAYSPFCAYSDNYSCPVVPQDNHLSVAVAAGEKDGGFHE